MKGFTNAANAERQDKDVSEAVKNLSSDLSNIAFQLALQNLIDTGDLVTVHVYEIDSASSITIISGQYANKKVYI